MPDSHAQRPPTGRVKPTRRVRRVRGTLLWTAVGLAVAVVATSGWLYYHVSGKIRSVDINAELGEDRPAPAEETGSGQTILVVGNDSDPLGDAENDTAGSTADAADPGTLPTAGSAMVIHLPEADGTPTAVNIPHDMPIARPDCAEADAAVEPPAELPFHAAHATGGPSCVVQVVEKLSGIRMDHYIEVDFAGFGSLVDALDGITVTTVEPIEDPRTGLVLPAGTHALDGSEAMAALRAASPEAQQRFLLALIREVNAQDVLGSPAKLYRVADAAAGSLTTDSALSSLTSLVSFARELGSANTDGMKIVALPAETVKAEPVWQSMRRPAGSLAQHP
jgi:LCP family protein required for cell wall assembly